MKGLRNGSRAVCVARSINSRFEEPCHVLGLAQGPLAPLALRSAPALALGPADVAVKVVFQYKALMQRAMDASIWDLGCWGAQDQHGGGEGTMFNRVILIGRLTRDPELRYTSSGTAVASFTLAVNRPFPNGKGEREADFIPVVAWRKLGETVSQYVCKGRLIAVEGRMQVRRYETKGGSHARVAEVIASAVRFLPDGRSKSNSEHDLVSAPEDDVVEEDPPG